MHREQLRSLISAILALGWLLTVFIGYIYIHKSFSPIELTAILLIVWRTFVAITVISVAGGIGLTTKLQNMDIAPLALAALSAALGLGILGIGILVIGATIGVNIFLWAVFFITAAFLWRKVLLWWTYCRDLLRLWREARKFSRIIIFLTTIILFCQYSVALAPPVQFDALTYHLAIPQSYIQAGQITYLPENVFWGMPEQTEMLYTLVMSIGGIEAGPVLGWWIGILALLGLVGFAEKMFGIDAAWVTVAGLMSGAALTGSFPSGYVEWVTMLFGLAMSVCLIHWSLNKNHFTLILAGVFAGMALGTKYTAGVALLAGFVVIIFFQKVRSFKQTAIDLFLFGGGAFIITLPWWIKNFLATSNPFYPLLFPSGAMDATRLAFYQFKPLTQDWSRLVLLPWQISIWGIDGGAGYSASIGPLLLGLSLLVMIIRFKYKPEQHQAMKISAVILLTGLLAMAIGSQFSGLLIQTRLYFVVFPAWALLCAAGYMAISQVNTLGIRFGNISAVFIVMALAFNTFFTATNVLKSGAFLTALEPEAHKNYLQNNLGGYELAMQAVEKLPKDAHVVMLWETRGLMCQPKCDSDEIIDRWYHDWHTYQNSNGVIVSWKKQGYTHLLINHGGADFIRENDPNNPSTPEYWDGLDTTLSLLNKIKDIGGGYELYALQ
jgi:hypothetical protein